MSGIESAWTAMLGGEIRYIDGGKYRTRCLRAGGGDEPPLVLIHGTGGHAESYLRNVMPLADRLPERDVYSIDLIGHGYSSKPGSYTLEDYAGHIEKFLSAIGHDSAHIHGESLGAAIAARLGLDHPELVETLGLNTMAVIADEIHEKALSAAQIERMNEAGQDLFDRTNEMMDAGFPRDLVRRRVDWLFHGGPPEELVDIRYEIYARETNREHMPQIYSGRSDMPGFEESDFERIDAPTLIIHTDHNPGTPADTMRYIHENCLSDSRLYVLEDAAHWPQWEQAELYNQYTAEFIHPTP